METICASQNKWLVYTTLFHLSHRYYEDLPNIAVIPVTGMVLCFVHDLVHEGALIIQGRKYVLRSDIMYRQFKYF